MNRKLARFLTVLAVTTAVAAPVLAADAPAAPAAQSDAPRDLSRYKEEPVPGGALLVVAYGVIWLVVAGFVGRLVLRQAKVERDLSALEDRLAGGGRS